MGVGQLGATLCARLPEPFQDTCIINASPFPGYYQQWYVPTDTSVPMSVINLPRPGSDYDFPYARHVQADAPV